jgi:hypothetical protein
VRARALLRRWRCFWHWPVGHAYELIDYVDPLSGRWAARARCVACGRETGLAVGDRRSGVHFSNNPLANMLTNQGAVRTVPASVKIGPGPPSPVASGLVVTAPDGGRIAVRYVQVRFYLGLRRSVYCAWRVGRENGTVVAPEFHLAVARAAGLNPSDPWVDRLARELAAEFVPVA